MINIKRKPEVLKDTMDLTTLSSPIIGNDGEEIHNPVPAFVIYESKRPPTITEIVRSLSFNDRMEIRQKMRELADAEDDGTLDESQGLPDEDGEITTLYQEFNQVMETVPDPDPPSSSLPTPAEPPAPAEPAPTPEQEPDPNSPEG